MALGAARARIIRQILTQSVLLSLIGGTAGIAVAYSLSHMILVLAFPQARNMPVQTNPSLPVLGFAFLVSLLTGILFGTAPAWLASQAKAVEALRGASRSAGNRSSLPQRALVVLQVGLSIVLLSAAFLMARSLANLEHQNFGIETANRYVLRFDPQGAGYTLERLPELYRQIEERFFRIALRDQRKLCALYAAGRQCVGNLHCAAGSFRSRPRRQVLFLMGARQPTLSSIHRSSDCTRT
jgi:hypothetical protein